MLSGALLLMHSLITPLGNVEERATVNRTGSCNPAAAHPARSLEPLPPPPLPLAATSDTLPTLHQTCNSGQTVAPGRLRTEVVSGRRALWSRQAPYLTTASQLRGLYTDDKNCHRDTGLHVSVGEEMLCRPELAEYSNLCR